MASRFDDSLTNFNEAVTALAIYTTALKATVAKNQAASCDRHVLKDTATVDVLDKIARQLDRAANELQGLYARTACEDRTVRHRPTDLDVA